MQKRTAKLVRWAASLSLLALGGAAQASGDYGCYYSRSLEMNVSPCSNAVALVPGNDTRANLNLLLRDAGGELPVPSIPPDRDLWREFDTARFSWSQFQEKYWPQSPARGSSSDYSGSHCQTMESGAAAFEQALAEARDVSAKDRAELIRWRSQFGAICGGETNLDTLRDWADLGRWSVLSRAGATRDFVKYLAASQAFYAEDWERSHSIFSELDGATDPWVRETSLYMAARVDLNAGQANAFDDWGDFTGPASTDKTLVKRAGRGFIAYLDAYPQGRYAASARGLQRRVLWLGGDDAELAAVYASALETTAGDDPALLDILAEIRNKSAPIDRGLLSTAYARLLRATDPSDPMLSGLLDEVDNKLVVPAPTGTELRDPLLVATWDFRRIRTPLWDEDGEHKLTRAELEGQRELFAGHEALYGLILASHAYYVEEDYGRVLQLLPDAARQESYSAVEFSRQLLRGQALAKRGDRNEEGFWLDLLKGAEPNYQRPLVELGLALNYERKGDTARAFVDGSPITDADIRETLLGYSAGADVLRAVIADATRPTPERRTAMRALLWKDLSRGRYADFGRDYRWLEGFAPDRETDWETYGQENYPLDEFRKGTWADEFSCPDIAATAARLARNANDSEALLCLGEFYRLNSFDHYDENRATYYGLRGQERQLGDGPDQFAGTLTTRAGLYRAVLANPRSTAEQRAYALYRSVWCYGPSGNNDCGGEDVPESQRAAWFHELKTRYPDSQWAQELKYYW